VRFRPSPRDETFFDLFAAAAAHLVTGSGLLAQILGADRPHRKELADQLRDAEHAADEAAHQIYRRLAQTFVTPFDREDLYHLASALDDCMDAMEEAGDLIVLYKIGDLPPAVSEQVAVLQRCAELTHEVMPKLKSMVGLREYWVEINRLENQADRAYRRLLAEIFDREHDPITVIKLKGVIDVLEAGADAFERLANGIETIALKES
jgi:predicted phosphate transport protein (TIGR00153 family)